MPKANTSFLWNPQRRLLEIGGTGATFGQHGVKLSLALGGHRLVEASNDWRSCTDASHNHAVHINLLYDIVCMFDGHNM